MTNEQLPERPAQPSERHISADGFFEYLADLGVWRPLGEVPPGTLTPDCRFQWTGVEWHPIYRMPTATRQTHNRTASTVFTTIVGALAGCGLLVVVAFVAIGAYFASHPIYTSTCGGKSC